MKQSKESLMLSGQTLYLREHTEQLKIQNDRQAAHDQLIIVIFLLIVLMIAALFWYIHHYNIWGNTIRTIGGC